MTPERLLKLYDRIADAPGAVSRLRRFVLELAVRGKLVKQIACEEPASELLKQIAAEQSNQGVRRKGIEQRTSETPFALPRGWNWTSIDGICTKTGSGSTPRGGKNAYRDTGIPFLRSQNVYNDGLRLDDVALIDEHTHERMSGTKVKPGDLLLNITGGSIGRCCLVPESLGDANISQHVAIIRPAVTETGFFLYWLVLSPYFQSFVVGEQTGAGRGGLPKNRMDKIAVALPPLAEQHRIVAKVDELMALCDRLEGVQNRAIRLRSRLLDSLLDEAMQPEQDH